MTGHLADTAAASIPMPLRYWLLAAGPNARAAAAALDLTEIADTGVFLRIKGVSTWTAPDGTFNVLDGFMMDDGFRPLDHEGVLDPEATGHGNFGYVTVTADGSGVSVFADAGESRRIFYNEQPGLFLAGNDLGMLVTGQKERRPNDRALFAYLRYGYLNINRDTFFDGVYQLKAGERLDIRVTEDTVVTGITQYWCPEIGDRSPNLEEAVEEVEANLAGFLNGAVGHFDNPMTTLTCGVDSNLFYYLLEKHVRRLPSLTHNFSHQAYDEFALLARERELGPDNYRIVTHEDAMAQLTEVIGRIGQPVNGLPSVGEQKLYRVAHNRGVDALITGVGDYVWVPLNEEIMARIREKPKLAYAGDGTLLPPTDYLSSDFHERQAATQPAFHAMDVTTDSWLKNHLLDEVFGKRTPHIAFSHSGLGAAFGIECIQPFLEKRTLEFCFSLADGRLSFDNQPKSLLVTLLNRLHTAPFPKSLKMNSPQREYIKYDYRESIEGLIRQSALVESGYVDRNKLTTLYRNYSHQEDLGNSYFVWKFIVTELWYQLFIRGTRIDLYPTYF